MVLFAFEIYINGIMLYFVSSFFFYSIVFEIRLPCGQLVHSFPFLYSVLLDGYTIIYPFY